MACRISIAKTKLMRQEELIYLEKIKGFESSFLNDFKILVGILFGSIALFVFIELIKFSMSFGRVGERKIVFLFSWPR